MTPDDARRLRSLLEGPRLVQVAGVHDAIAARLAERHGFDALWASGLGISAMHGVPDEGILTMGEFLAAATNVNVSCGLPVIADCDTGFGDPGGLVREYERAGIAGVCIEDQAAPKRNALLEGVRHQLAPVSEFVATLIEAKRAQTTPDFVLIARVEALIAGQGIEEARRRADAYAEAGADAILVHSRHKDDTEIAEFARGWDRELPLFVVPTTYPAVTARELEGLGIRAVIYANQGLRASIKAIDEAFRRIRETGSAQGVDREVASLRDVFDLQGPTGT